MPPFQSLFLVAHGCTCVLVAAVLAWWRPKPRAKTALFAWALALIAIAPGWGGWAHRPVPLAGSIAMLPFVAAALLMTLATTRPTPSWRTVLAAQGQTILFGFCTWIPRQDLTLAALHITWLAALIALERRASAPEPPARTHAKISYASHDVVIFLGATAIAAAAASFILDRYILSGDEWAYTVQADLFAHGKAYGAPRDCALVFKNWWVFAKDGRLFAQYTPGWPLVMAPFQRLGAIWLAAPLTTGVAAVATARLARRVAAPGIAGGEVPNSRAVVLAGYIAAAAFTACPSMLLNGASRYSHPLVCATWAWALEALSAITFDPCERRARVLWGVVLGSAAALLVATRPGDAAALGLPIAVGAALTLRRDRSRLDAFLAAAVPFAVIAALTLLILRAQLGTWLTTGYSLAPAGLKPALSLPRNEELGFALKLEQGAVWWLPCMPAGAALALIATRGRSARTIAAMLAGGWVLLVAMYSLSPLGRDPGESGYGPRMLLPAVVVMAVSSGVLGAAVIADVSSASRRLVTVSAMVVLGGTAYLGSFAYPLVHTWIEDKLALKRAIAEANLHHAVVVVHNGELAMQAWDETQNLATEPDPDVLVMTDYEAGADFACAEKRYGDRAWFVGSGVKKVELTPLH